MAENCNHNCDTCGKDCNERTGQMDKSAFLQHPHPESSIKHVIGVVSGKGGVGKSSVTSLLATALTNKGLNVAILDADITGPSIPKAFGVGREAQMVENALYPAFTAKGTQIMSVNMLLDNETDPVLWRGPIVAGMVKQFWTDVIWSDVDVMLVDMPPGTGDVPLTVFQSLPLDGVVLVTSPQRLVSMIVEKAVNMARKMDVPVLGMVENYSYMECPDCGKQLSVFGKSNIDELAKQWDVKNIVKLPIEPEFANAFDAGQIEDGRYKNLDRISECFVDELIKSLQ